jgi:hypothetical protein
MRGGVIAALGVFFSGRIAIEGTVGILNDRFRIVELKLKENPSANGIRS